MRSPATALAPGRSARSRTSSASNADDLTLVSFDSSALVKLVLDEEGSDACDAALSSRLAYPEVCAALAAAGRNHDLTTAEVISALADWETVWAAMRPVESTTDVERTAGALARDHQFRGPDAVHLARAGALGVTDLTSAAWDRRLRAAAAGIGFAVAPAALA